MRYKFTRWLRQITAWFGKKEGEEHYLFVLPSLLTPEEIWDKLWKHDWGYNVMSTAFKGQIITLRKLSPPRHQYHLRFYDDRTVTGHYEVDYTNFPLEHIDGVDLRPLTDNEKEELWQILTKE